MNFANFIGYKKDENGNLVVIPEEAETIKDIYFMFIEGKSMQDIETIWKAKA